ncbi:putative licABCH operon regulator [bioreactor metagenome]|uniref:Putative licABCH operon regulator n=1 Tax=bioreactor metagenome TaxID=1076179 RepID=A0A645BYV8_9ZZZZ
MLHEYSINLNTDDFIIRFSLHLSQLLNTQKKSNRNPLLKNIKDSYPLVFEVSVYIADIIHKHYPALLLDEHEISYIALHVGMSIDKDSHEKCTAILIIPQYYNLKDYIINRLYQNFYNSLLIIDACNDESEIDYSQPFEIILSTQSLTVSSEAESIQITPFINDQDLKNIQQTIEMVNMKKKIKSNEPLFRLFNPACFEIFHNPDADKNQIIKILGHKLIDAHYVPASFIEDVIIRETLSSTAYSSLAVPHTLNTSGIKTCIGVGIFPNNYQWDHNSINIVLLLVIQEKDKELFKMLFQTLIRIFTSKEWLEAYRKISSYDDYMRFVKNLMIFK